MGMLDRYQKSGGFVQLVALLEACGQAKQEKFLEIIRGENSIWADAVKSKLLSVEKIYSWNDDTLAEIFGTLQDLTVAVAVFAGGDPLKERIFKFLSHGRRRKIEDLMGMSKPTPAEIASMHIKMIESVRKMAMEGSIRFDRFDASMVIDDGIEDKLNRSAVNAEMSDGDVGLTFDVETSVPNDKADHHGDSEARIVEIQSLKKRVTELSKETAVLRHELSVARGKLDQIKKIA